MKIILSGRIQGGKNDASVWLRRFNDAYSRKLGMPVFPGSLNVALDESFDWFVPQWKPKIIWFGREEYGGERDILLLPCMLRHQENRRAFLWTTITAARDRPDPWVIELVTDIGLRRTYGLRDGDTIIIELDI
jgi:riboflavin kinase, archaea type